MGVRRYWCSDDVDSSADLRRVLFGEESSAAAVRTSMIALYADLPFSQREAYRGVVHSLSAGDVPLVFHCAAGKDRTGVLAALLLAYLGASDADILADYLFSNAAPDHLAAIATEARDGAGAPHEVIAAELREPLLTADPRYLEAMFMSLQQRCGGVAAYFEDALVVGQEMRAGLEAILVENSTRGP
jgi:protein-tyrosine phosphatase